MASIINAAFLGIIGIGGLSATRSLFARQKTIASWPTVQGRILSKEATAPNGSARYRLAVRYAYDVGGNSHESTQYAPVAVYSRLRRVIEKDIAAVPGIVTVSYNPENPDEAYLSLGPVFWPRVGQVACGLFVVVALLMLAM